MSASKWKHRPCPCGCGELADECMSPASALNAFHIDSTPAPLEVELNPDGYTIHQHPAREDDAFDPERGGS